MPSPSITILFFILILFSTCSRSDRGEIPPSDELKLNLVSPAFYNTPKADPGSIYGQWRVKHIFMYFCELQIKRGGSFTFFERGCLGSSYSEGTWRESGDNYVMQSLDKFKNDSNSIYKRDSVYRYFNNEPFRVVGDTLFTSVAKFVMEQQY